MDPPPVVAASPHMPPPAIDIRCWNKACAPDGQRKRLLQVVVLGPSRFELLLPCPRCRSFNIRVIENGVLTN